MYKELLMKRLDTLENNTRLISQRMNQYPKGHLKTNMQNGGYYYRIVDEKTGKRKYVRKDNINEARMIAQRDYECDYLKMAKREISEIKKMISRNYFEKTKDCYSKLYEGRKKLVQPFEMSDEDYIKQWVAIPYTPKAFMDNDITEYYTEKNERVRSKSEVIIANMLKALNIPYKYECPLKLGNIVAYPDFTILDVKGRREIYFEHFGMMGDIDYVNTMVLKITTYEQNKFLLGDRLICTFESAKRPLNIAILKNKLNTLI